MIVRLSHPWRHHYTRDVLDTEAGDLTEAEASQLISGGIARNVDDLMVDQGGGWYEVTLAGSGETVKAQGREAAIDALRADALP